MGTETGKTRRAILNLIKRRGTVTVADLVEHLAISDVAVRKHLTALEAAGLVTFTTEQRQMGRPAQVYSLTEEADELFPKNYDQLATTLLEQIIAIDGAEKADTLFAARRSQFEAVHSEEITAKPLRERVAAVAKIQDDNGYLCDWSEEPDGSFRIVEHNCAICKVAKTYPQACREELNLIRNLTGADVCRTTHMASGDHACSYVIREKPVENA
jgi:predicted ArsR family transcriptional regulator